VRAAGTAPQAARLPGGWFLDPPRAAVLYSPGVQRTTHESGGETVSTGLLKLGQRAEAHSS